VQRGGAFWRGRQDVRCAHRIWYDARGGYGDMGLRVVVAALP
jgi:formylglycine-generating enzyme required for sulfatase activity